MSKNRLTLYYIIPLVVCQVLVMCVGAQSVGAITDTQHDAIVKRCDNIRDELRKVQKEDSKTRVYLGGYYETIITKFITPLNVRLVENNLSSASLVENQNKMVAARTVFANDFITYQQGLEELVGADCKHEPEKFYDKLTVVQQKRKMMAQDVMKMRNLISEHMKLVTGLKGKV